MTRKAAMLIVGVICVAIFIAIASDGEPLVGLFFAGALFAMLSASLVVRQVILRKLYGSTLAREARRSGVFDGYPVLRSLLRVRSRFRWFGGDG